MATVLVLAGSLPVVLMAAAAAFAAPNGPPDRTTDMRGIALQTVIIIVVLVAIAGGVSVALIGRGGEAIEEMERQTVTTPASTYKNETLCKTAGNNWYGGSCHEDARKGPDEYSTAAGCRRVGYTWDPIAKTCGP